ncbi:MAG: 5-bromo-4-chloroindolyl phosphate hydrolysis family protein [Pseudomonadota bacterium]
MAQRYGGKYSPGRAAGKATSAKIQRGAAPSGPSLRPSHGTPLRMRGRRNLLYLTALPLLWTAFRQDALGMAVDLAAAATIAGAVFLVGEGIKAEDAYNERKVARRPAFPRKIVAAVTMGFGVFLAALQPDAPAFFEPLLYGLIAVAAFLTAFGLDPLHSKGVGGADSFQSERVARAVDEAEAHLEAMGLAIARSGDRALERRVEAFQTTARQMFRTVEDDPRDLTSARKFLGVYLIGARDATVKFADLYSRTHDDKARADYLALLDDLENNFAKKTVSLMESDRTDLDVEIEVLRERLVREGVKSVD